MKKTTIITPFGLFEFLQMPFGLKNASMSFQRFMDRILGGLPFVLIYLDDILVASPDRATHKAHLRAVLQILRENGLVLNRSKCKFFRSEVEFLGLRVTAGIAQNYQRAAGVPRSREFLPPVYTSCRQDPATPHRCPQRRHEGSCYCGPHLCWTHTLMLQQHT